MKEKNIFFKAISSVSFYLNKKQKKKMALFVLALLFTSLLDVIGLAAIIPVIKIATDPDMIQSSYYVSMVYNFLGFQETKTFLLFLICGVFGLFLFKNAVIIFVNYRLFKFLASVTVKITDNQFSKYYRLKFWEFNNIGASRVINYVNGTPNLYSKFLLLSLFKVIAEIFVIAFIVAGIALYEPVLFLILAGILGPATIFIYQALKNRTQKIGDEMDALRPESFSIIYDSFAGYADIKLADKQKNFQDRFLKIRKDFLELGVFSNLYKLLPPKVIETVAILGVVLIFIYSLFLSNQTTSILTLLGLFVAAAYRLMPSINRILSSFMALKQHHFTMDNLEKYRDKTYQENIDSNQKPLSFHQKIRVSNLGYSFPDAKVQTLKNISLTVKKGEKIGIIGPSGSGKTTLMNLLLGFYEQDEGTVYIDDEPLGKHNLQSWRNLIGYVRQDVFLMEGTIVDNITLGDKEVDEYQLNKAIERASLNQFIDSLPEGIDTHIGEKGSKLSGGQKQRVGIARALYHKAEILFFDEATSALDNKTEKEVTEAINRLSGTNVTLFIIAHRITTLKDCDRIYELKDGSILAEHDYEEAIAKVV